MLLLYIVVLDTNCQRNSQLHLMQLVDQPSGSLSTRGKYKIIQNKNNNNNINNGNNGNDNNDNTNVIILFANAAEHKKGGLEKGER